MNLENPTSSFIAMSRTEVPSAPDWERKAILPLMGFFAPNEVLKSACESIVPRQFGPSKAISNLFAISFTLFSNILPASPISLNPAEIIITFFIPLFPHSVSICGTISTRTAIIARSIGSPTSETDLYVLSPRISLSEMLTG